MAGKGERRGCRCGGPYFSDGWPANVCTPRWNQKGADRTQQAYPGHLPRPDIFPIGQAAADRYSLFSDDRTGAGGEGSDDANQPESWRATAALAIACTAAKHAPLGGTQIAPVP